MSLTPAPPSRKGSSAHLEASVSMNSASSSTRRNHPLFDVMGISTSNGTTPNIPGSPVSDFSPPHSPDAGADNNLQRVKPSTTTDRHEPTTVVHHEHSTTVNNNNNNTPLKKSDSQIKLRRRTTIDENTTKNQQSQQQISSSPVVPITAEDRAASVLSAPGSSSSNRDTIPRPPNWGWKRRRSSHSGSSNRQQNMNASTTNNTITMPPPSSSSAFNQSITNNNITALNPKSTVTSSNNPENSSSHSASNNNSDPATSSSMMTMGGRTRSQSFNASSSQQSHSQQLINQQYQSLTQHPIFGASLSASGPDNLFQYHGGKYSSAMSRKQSVVSFISKNDVPGGDTSDQVTPQQGDLQHGNAPTPPPRPPKFGEPASEYSAHLQQYHPQQLHTHADLKRQGQCLHQDDHTNLVGSATGQVAALLVNVVSAAGVILEGEILESLQSGTSYRVRCPIPDKNLETKSEAASRRFRKGQPRFTQNVREENIEDDLKPFLESVVRSVTPDGLTDDEVKHQTELEKATMKKFFTAVFKRRDVLPYGFQAPSAVFNRLGRHTNLGLIIGWDATYFTYQIEQRIYHSSFSPTRHAENLRRGFTKNSDISMSHYKTRVVSAALSELQLPPSLTRGNPRNSYRVGSLVECRRFGLHDLDTGVVLAVNRDVTYKIKFKSDDEIQDGILHSDVRLVSESRAERCGVRDRVLVGLMGAKRATVIQFYQDGRFRVVTDDGEQLLLGDSNVLSVRPIILEAVGASKKLIELFDLLDEGFTGKVSWLKFRKEILGGPWVPGVLAPLGTSTHIVPTARLGLHETPSGRVSPVSRRQSLAYNGGMMVMNHHNRPGSDHQPRSVAESRLRLHRLSVLATIQHLQQSRNENPGSNSNNSNEEDNSTTAQNQSPSSLPGSADHSAEHSGLPPDGWAKQSSSSSKSNSPGGGTKASPATSTFGGHQQQSGGSASSMNPLFAPVPDLQSLRRESLVRWANVDLPPHLMEINISGNKNASNSNSPQDTNSPSSNANSTTTTTNTRIPARRPLAQASPISLEVSGPNNNNSSSLSMSATQNPTMSFDGSASASVAGPGGQPFTRRPRKQSVVFKVDDDQENATITPFASHLEAGGRSNDVTSSNSPAAGVLHTPLVDDSLPVDTTNNEHDLIDEKDHHDSNNNNVKEDQDASSNRLHRVQTRPFGPRDNSNSQSSNVMRIDESSSSSLRSQQNYYQHQHQQSGGGGSNLQVFGANPTQSTQNVFVEYHQQSNDANNRSRRNSFFNDNNNNLGQFPASTTSPNNSFASNSNATALLSPAHHFYGSSNSTSYNNNINNSFAGLQSPPSQQPSRRASLFGASSGVGGSSSTPALGNESFVGLFPSAQNARSRASSQISSFLPRLQSPRQSLVPTHLLENAGNSSITDSPGGGGYFLNNSSHGGSMVNTNQLVAGDISFSQLLLGGAGYNQNTGTAYSRSRAGTMRTSQANALLALHGVKSLNSSQHHHQQSQQPNLVSVISSARGRDTESAAMEKEMQRQECLHDEVQEALDKAYDQYNAIKGIPPNAFHAGHDASLNFLDMAFLFERVARDLEQDM